MAFNGHGAPVVSREIKGGGLLGGKQKEMKRESEASASIAS
jgi:hypothetical protein